MKTILIGTYEFTEITRIRLGDNIGINYYEIMSRFEKQCRREGLTIEDDDAGLTLYEFITDRNINFTGFCTVMFIDKQEITTEDFTALTDVIIGYYEPNLCKTCKSGYMEHSETVSENPETTHSILKCTVCDFEEDAYLDTDETY